MPEFTEFPIPRKDVEDLTSQQQEDVRAALGLPAATQAEAEAGTEPASRTFSPLRVRQAIQRRAYNPNVYRIEWAQARQTSVGGTGDVLRAADAMARLTTGASAGSHAAIGWGANNTTYRHHLRGLSGNQVSFDEGLSVMFRLGNVDVSENSKWIASLLRRGTARATTDPTFANRNLGFALVGFRWFAAWWGAVDLQPNLVDTGVDAANNQRMEIYCPPDCQVVWSINEAPVVSLDLSTPLSGFANASAFPAIELINDTDAEELRVDVGDFYLILGAQ